MSDHLTDQDFTRLACGAVSELEFDQVLEHLDSCAVCAQRFDDGAACHSADTLISQAHQALTASDPIAAEPGCEKLERWLEAGLAAENHRREVLLGDYPKKVGPYELEHAIGSGGMGVVFQARHAWLNRYVALKLMRVDRGVSPQSIRQFTEEFEAIGRLDHPNIVRPLDAGCSQGQAFLAMELIDGIDLARLRRRCGLLTERDVAEIGYHAASGLAHAHENGIIHRDVKPSNLMLSLHRGTHTVSVKVMDLGLVRMESSIHPKQSNERTVGTVGFQAPEQISDPEHVDPRADIYGLGATLLVLSSERSVDEFRDRFDAVASPFQTLIAEMLLEAPDARPASMEAIVSRLDEYRTGSDLNRCLEEAQHRLDSDSQFLSWSVLTDRLLSQSTTKNLQAQTDTQFDENEAAPVSKPWHWFFVGLVGLGLSVALAYSMMRGMPPALPVDRSSGSGKDAVSPAVSEKRISLERQVAELVFALGGEIDYGLTGSLEEWQIKSAEQLPYGPFRITWVMLNHTEADDEACRLVSQLPHLIGAGLSYSKVTDRGVKHLGKAKTLQSVFLYHTDVSDSGIEPLTKLPELTELIISETDITNLTVERLQSCQKLERLTLKDTLANRECIPMIAKMKGLKEVDLRTLNLRDEDLKPLYAMPRLTDLLLARTGVSENAIAELAEIETLEYLELNGDFLGEPAIKRLKEKLPQIRVEVDWDE